MSFELVIIWAIFFFILGFTTAYIIFRIREERNAAGKAKTEQPNQPATEAEATLPVSRKIRVWVEVDGQQVEAEVKEAGKPVFTADKQSTIQLPATLSTEQPSTTSQSLEKTTSITPPLQTSKPADSSPPTPISPLRDPINTLLRAVQSGGPKPEFQPKSMIAQIDDVLQEKLTALHLLERRIHLVETPDHGMAVQLGSAYYDGIEAVPDEKTRSLIRGAIQEWEYRNMGK
jgi:hypothetical protein